MLLRHLDDGLLKGLHLLPGLLVDARDDPGRAHGELEAFPPHVLDQDRDVQLPAPGDHELVSRVPGLDAQSEVALQLAVEALLEVARRHELALSPGEGARVHGESHADGGLLDGDRGERIGALALADGLADRDVRQARDGADVAGLARFGFVFFWVWVFSV